MLWNHCQQWKLILKQKTQEKKNIISELKMKIMSNVFLTKMFVQEIKTIRNMSCNDTYMVWIKKYAQNSTIFENRQII